MKFVFLPFLGLLMFLAGCAAHSGPNGANDRSYDEDFASFAIGALAMETKDPMAADYFLRALEDDPNNSRVMMRAFSASLLEGRYDDVLRLSKRLSAQEQPNFLPQIILVLQDMRQKRWGRADERMQGLYGTGFDTLIAPILHAWILAADGDKDAALQRIGAVERNAALRGMALSHKAFILSYLKERDEASLAFQFAIQPGNLSSYMPVAGYADLLVSMDRSGEAVEVLDRYLKNAPNNDFLKRRRALAVAGETAELSLKQPVGAGAYAFFQIASQFANRQATQPAMVYARLSNFLQRDYDEALILTGNLLAEAERYDSALMAFQSVDPNGRQGNAARYLFAYTLQAAGRGEDAIAALDTHIEKQAEQTPARDYVTLADLYRQAERHDEAIVAYSRALDLGGTDTRPWYILFARGVSYEQSDRWPEAEADFLASIEADGERAEVLNYLGYSWIDRNMNLDQGFELIEKAIKLSPDSGFIIDSLGWAYYLQGDYERSVGILERATLLEPDDPTINDHLGDAYWRVGRKREARFQWSHALKAEPEAALRAQVERKLASELGLAALDQPATETAPSSN